MNHPEHPHSPHTSVGRANAELQNFFHFFLIFHSPWKTPHFLQNWKIHYFLSFKTIFSSFKLCMKNYISRSLYEIFYCLSRPFSIRNLKVYPVVHTLYHTALKHIHFKTILSKTDLTAGQQICPIKRKILTNLEVCLSNFWNFSYWRALFPKRPEQCMCRAVFPSPFKITTPSKSGKCSK